MRLAAHGAAREIYPFPVRCLVCAPGGQLYMAPSCPVCCPDISFLFYDVPCNVDAWQSAPVFEMFMEQSRAYGKCYPRERTWIETGAVRPK